MESHYHNCHMNKPQEISIAEWKEIMALPAVRGTMTRIGCRVGHAWACDGVEFMLSKVASALAMSANPKNRPLFMPDLLPMPSERCTKSPSDNLCRVRPFLQTIAVAKFIA